MAGRLRTSRCLLCTVIFASMVSHVGAQSKSSPPSSNLADPTRPPAEVELPTSAAVDPKALAASVGLQTIVLKKKRSRSFAIINGETARLGDKVGDAKLVRLSETEAVLEGPNGKEIMQMTPGIDKKIRRAPKSRKSQGGGRAKHAPKQTD